MGKTKIYQSLQMYTVIEEEGSLKDELFLNAATQIGMGMEYVNEGIKQNMLSMKSAFNSGITESLGYGNTAATTIKTLDNDLILEHIIDTIDSNADRIISSRTGAPTEEEVGVDYLQNTYADFNADTWTFTHTDGLLYRYAYSIYAGSSQIDIVSYKVLTQADVESILNASYDEFNITSMPSYPSSGEWTIPFTYTEYTVTVTTETTTEDEEGNSTTETTTNTYTTTKLGDVTSGTVSDENSSTTTSIDETTESGTLTRPVEYLYLNAGDAIETFFDIYATENNNSVVTNQANVILELDNDLNNTIVDFAENRASSIYSVQRMLDTGYANVVDFESTLSVGVTSATSVSIAVSNIEAVAIDDPNVDISTVLISDYVLEALTAKLKAIEEDKVKKAWAEYDSSTTIVVYTIGGGTKQVFLDRADIEHCYIDEVLDAFPVIPLKEDGILDDNPNRGVILRQMGLTGDEFNDSLADQKLKYASIGFSIPINEAPASLVYNTLEYLEATGVNTTGEKEWIDGSNYRNTAGTSFTLEYGNLKMITELDLHKEIKSGYYDPSETVGAYYMYTEEYDYEYTERNEWGQTVTKTKSAIKYHYIKQETEDYYLVRTVDRLRTEYRYNGATGDTVLGDRIYTDIGSEDEAVARLPLLRGALAGIGYNDYLMILEKSLTLFVHSYQEVETKWYQTGFFKFLMVIVAVVITYVTQGAAAKFAYKLLYYAAVAGAYANLIIALASVTNIKLGVVGDILQVVAIIGNIANLANTAYTMTSQGAASLANAQGELASEAYKASGEALKNGSTQLAESLMAEGDKLAALSAESAMLSTGEVVTSTTTTASEGLKTASEGLKKSTEGTIKIPGTDIPAVKSLQVLEKTVSTVGDIMDFDQQRKLNQLAMGLADAVAAREKAEEELREMQETRHTALLMSPSQVSTYYEDSLNLDSIFDLSSNLELPSTDISVWT